MFQISVFHRMFGLKEGNDISNILSKFQDHTSMIFFQNGDFKNYLQCTNFTRILYGGGYDYLSFFLFPK